MLFNSAPFLIFFVTVYSLYLALPHKWQNRMLLAASYFFYGYWDWRFLSLLFISTAVDYVCGVRIETEPSPGKRKLFLLASICTNLGILGFFKYFNFFSHSLQMCLQNVGLGFMAPTLDIVLPVGISFYTFQTMSYTIDVYRKDIEACRNFWDFALYVSFFPQLVAGPIERAKHLLPQVVKERTLSRRQVIAGVLLILMGLVKKVFIADNLAPIVQSVFSKSGGLSGWETLLGVYAFAFQIYGDFSGYSDIARGLSFMMGFDLMVNFNLPYFAKNPSDFWKRWHISLSTWLRDYLYIPLGGNRKGRLRTYINLILTMLLGGLWHGANWTFVLWGLYHGCVLAIHRFYAEFIRPGLTESLQKAVRLKSLVSIIVMFHIVAFGWLLFRSQSVAQVGLMIRGLFTDWSLNWTTCYYFKELSLYVLPLLAFQAIQEYKKDHLFLLKEGSLVRVGFAAGAMGLILVIYSMGMAGSTQFIYFQF